LNQKFPLRKGRRRKTIAPGQEGTDIITVLQNKEYIAMIREKLNVIKKVQKQYNYVPA